MKRLEILAVGLVCGLVVSLVLNNVVLMEIQRLGRSYDELRQSYEELSLSFALQPPISKSQAIDIAIRYGGWSEATLKGREITATLCYARFYAGTESYNGFEVLYRVAEPVSDYSQVHIADETYRYIWWVIVQQEPKPVHAPPPSHYIIDATTGEVIYAI